MRENRKTNMCSQKYLEKIPKYPRMVLNTTKLQKEANERHKN